MNFWKIPDTKLKNAPKDVKNLQNFGWKKSYFEGKKRKKTVKNAFCYRFYTFFLRFLPSKLDFPKLTKLWTLKRLIVHLFDSGVF